MVKIREALFNDFKDVMVLKNRYGLRTQSYEEWQHLWRNNPIIINIKKSWPIGWVLENDDKKIVGYFGNIPVAYEFKGERLIAAVASSWVVDVPYRNYSILLINNYFAQKNADLFLSTTTNYAAGKAFSSFRAQKVPVDSYDISLFWIINYQKFICSVLAKKKLPFAHIISYPLSLTLWSVNKLIKKNHCISQINRGVECYTAFDERFDLFWEKMKNLHNCKLLCVRSSQHLNWHFKYALLNGRVWIFGTEKKSEITSYAIFLREDVPKIGLRRIILVDFQTIDDNPNVLREMLLCGLEKCRKDDIYMLEIIGLNLQKRSILETCSPIKRKLSSWPFFYKAKDNLLARELEKTDVWDPCSFDGDASL